MKMVNCASLGESEIIRQRPHTTNPRKEESEKIVKDIIREKE